MTTMTVVITMMFFLCRAVVDLFSRDEGREQDVWRGTPVAKSTQAPKPLTVRALQHLVHARALKHRVRETLLMRSSRAP